MSGITSGATGSFKKELLEGVHHLQGTITVAGTTTNTSQSLTALAAIADLSAGLLVTDASGDIPANAYTSRLLTSASIGMDKTATGTHAGQNLTFKGDSLACVLIKHLPTGTYGPANTNYSDITGNADEVTGTGYTAGGFVWAQGAMVTPAYSGTQAYTQPSTNASWTSATIDADGCALINVSQLNKMIGLENFGGEQKVTAGTFTVLNPVNGAGTSLFQLN